MYYYIVLTSPTKEFHDVDNLNEYLKKNFKESIVVSEMGDKGTNPHINVIVKLDKRRIDNVRRGILPSYYGPKLSEFESNNHFNKYGAVGKNIKDLPNLKNILNYIKKEDQYNQGRITYYYPNGIDMYELTEGMLPYEEHTKLQEGSCSFARSAEQLLQEMICEYQRRHLDKQQSFLSYFGHDKSDTTPLPTKEDFKDMLKYLIIKGFNITPITSKLKIYYVEFMSRLGNFCLLESMVDRIDDELNYNFFSK